MSCDIVRIQSKRHLKVRNRLCLFILTVQEDTIIIATYRPDEVAIEQVFVHNNPSSALKLGQARGAAIVALAQHNMPVAEYSARQIKQAIVGFGAADKVQVQRMIASLLNLKNLPREDAADALAVAVCHFHTGGNLKKINDMVEK